MTKWQIFGAVALRKLPEVRPQIDIIESRVQQVFDLYEVAISKLSKHEMQDIEDVQLKQSDNPEVIIKETAQDRLDAWVKEKSTFSFASYDDRLSKVQYLFVKDKFGSDMKDQWLLPQAIYNSQLDSSLIDTARRALKDSLNIVNGFRIVSKIPSSVDSFHYPKSVVEKTGFDGAKVFYLKAHLDLPSRDVLEAVDCSKIPDRMQWLTLKEARNIVNRSYIRGLAKGTLREDRIDVQKILVQAAKYAAEEQLRQERLQKNLKSQRI